MNFNMQILKDLVYFKLYSGYVSGCKPVYVHAVPMEAGGCKIPLALELPMGVS